ncbi:hypothetical protein [Mucilaginibacter sp.]|uniref:hypothetical protein n=1 Tax=Mucilaginibacter sp. TaxID=1882438 RepID=UPI0025D92429|nr:hypothetical protein [Mucilaginibacter sp.]
MYDIRPNSIIGFHGCDLSVRDHLINNPNNIEISREPHDWLGHGMYFWENNYTRAMEWAEQKATGGKIKNPAVLGAILQLGHCCDFLDSKYLRLIKQYHEMMKEGYEIAGKNLPQNIDATGDRHHDKLLRILDCAVIEYMHNRTIKLYNKEIADNDFSTTKIFDSTRGVFTEGGPAFAGAGILEKSHIQVCIRNMNCIKGFFIPRDEISFP